MNIQGECGWVVGEKRVRIYQKSSRDVLVSISILKGVDIAIAIAERIVQTHNSFDELLRVSKIMYDAISNSEWQLHPILGNGQILKKTKSAIAEAELE